MTNKQFNKLGLKVIEILKEEGENEIRIMFKGDEIKIGCYSETLRWNVLERVKAITDNPKCIWEVRIEENELFIVLIREI